VIVFRASTQINHADLFGGRAQQDGYLSNQWMELDADFITNKTKDRHEPLPKGSDGPLHWNTGPPYLATARDMYRIAVRWTEYAPRVVVVYPQLFAEMYGEC